MHRLSAKRLFFRTKKHRSPDGLPTDICLFTILSVPRATKTKSLPHKQLAVLLIKRKSDTYGEQWALPGGFSKESETLDECAYRELKEETNIDRDVHIEQLKTYYKPGRDPRGWIPSVAYVSLVHEDLLKHAQAADDASDAQLFPIEEAFALNLAFDHREILTDALQRVREKMLQTNIAKAFLPERFTLSELLQVIETVVPSFKVNDRGNFERRLLATTRRQGILEAAVDDSGQPVYSTEYSNSPAKLYRFSDFIPTAMIY
ncbi:MULTISPECIES: NUDIX hydrolase [Brevibacillus]|jgi:8-oxo-dGTP diphosphatase|uniref:ADP-ribose pyrophosphatase n=1 Tax=Brevibacillus parabrevis TaxID=54914 RepID=A0A4Y3PX88_BREPA|nr:MULTISPECIES: NUDIX domain-containing protein [Brevibacillus]MBU8712551.1 NUDIX hydrolase [Brevibacillus parabrevis]MDR5000171.1 NUDIX domain-containing protein [Brevibacillus parabrevis]RNB96418.1 NUDIX domain-containing protein [Brevibacillus parabrevis]WDV98137.1 NUDIX domain-containing protein [Brevibacillus parabrevis]GEB35651.1 ADP-ribose pyrophosphatase [Brevibacillus parabrevis]